MPSALALHLAERFAADARGLRARAGALAGARAPETHAAGTRPSGTRSSGGRAGAGPDAASYVRMADACDRVQRLFEEAAEGTPDDEELRALLPQLAALVAGARSPEERNVYAGAVARLTEGLEGGADDNEDDE